MNELISCTVYRSVFIPSEALPSLGLHCLVNWQPDAEIWKSSEHFDGIVITLIMFSALLYKVTVFHRPKLHGPASFVELCCVIKALIYVIPVILAKCSTVTKQRQNGALFFRSSKGMLDGLKVIITSSICFAISVTIALILTIYLAPPQVSSLIFLCQKFFRTS